jgi:hypothetical protein
MHISKMLAAVALCGLMAACSSPQDDAARAQEEVSNERLKLIDEYRACMNEAGGDNAKVEACDTYLKAAEALK